MTTKQIARTFKRTQIVEALESIGIACYSDESTKLLRDCLIENVESGNLEIYADGGYSVLCY